MAWGDNRQPDNLLLTGDSGWHQEQNDGKEFHCWISTWVAERRLQTFIYGEDWAEERSPKNLWKNKKFSFFSKSSYIHRQSWLLRLFSNMNLHSNFKSPHFVRSSHLWPHARTYRTGKVPRIFGRRSFVKVRLNFPSHDKYGLIILIQGSSTTTSNSEQWSIPSTCEYIPGSRLGTVMVDWLLQSGVVRVQDCAVSFVHVSFSNYSFELQSSYTTPLNQIQQ